MKPSHHADNHHHDDPKSRRHHGAIHGALPTVMLLIIATLLTSFNEQLLPTSLKMPEELGASGKGDLVLLLSATIGLLVWGIAADRSGLSLQRLISTATTLLGASVAFFSFAQSAWLFVTLRVTQRATLGHTRAPAHGYVVVCVCQIAAVPMSRYCAVSHLCRSDPSASLRFSRRCLKAVGGSSSASSIYSTFSGYSSGAGPPHHSQVSSRWACRYCRPQHLYGWDGHVLHSLVCVFSGLASRLRDSRHHHVPHRPRNRRCLHLQSMDAVRHLPPRPCAPLLTS